MVGSHEDALGGMASVIFAYRRFGLFDRWPIVYLSSHRPGGVSRRLITAAEALATFFWLILRRKVALVHLHCSQRGSFWRKTIFAAISFISGVPVLFHIHGSEFHTFFQARSGPLRWFMRKILSRSARIIVLSPIWEKRMRGLTPGARIVIVPNPCVPIDLPPGVVRRDDTLLFLGRLGKRKGIYDLLSVIPRLIRRFPRLRLLCGGDGEVDLAQRRADELGIAASVEFLGWVEGARKRALLAEAAIFVLPSYDEGVPMSILEAMGAGLPIVSTRAGGIPDAVDDGAQGILINAGDVAALEAALAELLASPQRRAELGAAGRRRAGTEFSIDRSLRGIEALYRECGVGSR